VNANVLMYHHIGALPSNADSIRQGLTVSSEEFDAQLKYLSQNGFTFLTLEQLNKDITAKKIPDKVVVMTFDDGYDNNFKDAWPLMKKYNAKGTFFIITSKIGKDEYMTKEQIKELSDAGNEIGSHSVTHPNLATTKGKTLENEIVQSRADLEGIISRPVVSFCYPAGKYNDDTINAIKSAGYKMAVTTRSSTGIVQLDSLFTISRHRISQSMNLEALLR